MGSSECKKKGRLHTLQYPQLTLKEPTVHFPAEAYLAITITINTVLCVISLYPAVSLFNFNLENHHGEQSPLVCFLEAGSNLLEGQ